MIQRCDFCGMTTDYFRTENISGKVACRDCSMNAIPPEYRLATSCLNKKRLHKALPEDSSDTNHPIYSGGILSFPNGFSLSISWDKKDQSWNISNIHIVDDSDIKEFLNYMYSKIPEAFSDEEEISYKEFTESYSAGRCFWTSDGSKWILSSDRSTSIQVEGKSGLPTGRIMVFQPDTLVYIDREINEHQNYNIIR